MPSAQRGQLEKRGDRWSARWRDENGRSRRRTFGVGREGKAAAAAFLDTQVGQVEAVRRGETPVARRRTLTVAELADRYLAQHEADPVTIRKLRRETRPGRRPLRRPAARDPRAGRARRVAQDALARSPPQRLPGAPAGARAGGALEVDRREPRPLRQEPEAEGTRDRAVRFVGGNRHDRRRARPPLRRDPRLRGRDRSSSRGVGRARAARRRQDRPCRHGRASTRRAG